MKQKYLPAKLTYFLFYSGLALLNTFFTIFLINLGFDPEQAGLIQVARSGIMIGSGLFWGWLAHKTNRNLLIVCVEILVSTALINMMPWVAQLMVTQETVTGHREHIREAVLGNTTINHTSFSKISNADLSTLFQLHWEPSHYRTASQYLFLTMLGLSIVSTFFIGGALMMIETKVYNMTIRNSRGKNIYGRQRLWGSVSIAIIPLTAGTLIESLPKNPRNPLQVVFYMHMVIMLGAVISCSYLFRQETPPPVTIKPTVDIPSPGTHDFHSPQFHLSTKQVLKKTFKDNRNLMLFSNILIMGLVYGIQWNFQFLFLQEIGSPKTMMGLCVTIQFVVETMVYPFAMRVISKLGGNKVVTTMALFSYALFFFALCVLKLPILVVIPTAILGFFFALFHNATMDDLYQIGGATFMTILQALYHIIFTGVGCSLSGIVGGAVYKHYGGRVLFFSTGVLLTFGGIYNIIYLIVPRAHHMPKIESNVSIHSDSDPEKSDASSVTSDEGIFLSMDELTPDTINHENETVIG